jgi:cyanate permease
MTMTYRVRIAGLAILLALLAVAAGYAVDGWRGAFYVALIAFLLAVSTYLFDRCTQPQQEKNTRHTRRGSR